MTTQPMTPNPTACLTYPNADHSACPSSVECFHAVAPDFHSPSNDDDCASGACSHVTLPGEKDSMQAYTADRHPALAPFAYFGAPSTTPGYHSLFRMPYMANLVAVGDIPEMRALNATAAMPEDEYQSALTAIDAVRGF